MESIATQFTFKVGSFYDYLQQMKNARKSRGKGCELPVVLLFVVLAKFCGEDTPFGVANRVKNRSEWLLK
jgi:hypothetical protein